MYHLAGDHLFYSLSKLFFVLFVLFLFCLAHLAVGHETILGARGIMKIFMFLDTLTTITPFMGSGIIRGDGLVSPELGVVPLAVLGTGITILAQAIFSIQKK